MNPNPRFERVNIMVTRRVNNRVYRLRPSKKLNRIVRYVIAILVKHYGLELHALVVMSNHYHARFFDPFGQASNFSRDCHAMIAKLVIKTFDEDEELLWSPKPTNEVETEIPEDGIEQIAYILANPVAATAVRFGHSWPGQRGAWPDKPRTVQQPFGFFQEDTWKPDKKTESGNPAIHWAESATLEFTRPRGFDHLEDNELVIKIREATRRREDAAREEVDNDPTRKFIGRRGVLTMSRSTRSVRKPASDVAPRIKSSDPERRIQRLSGIRVWRADHRRAMSEWTTNRNVVFPYGTNKMSWLHRVTVDDAPT